MAKRKLIVLAVDIGAGKAVVATSFDVEVGDMVAYCVGGGPLVVGEVISCIETVEGSELHNWLRTVSNIDEKIVSKAWHLYLSIEQI